MRRVDIDDVKLLFDSEMLRSGRCDIHSTKRVRRPKTSKCLSYVAAKASQGRVGIERIERIEGGHETRSERVRTRKWQGIKVALIEPVRDE